MKYLLSFFILIFATSVKSYPSIEILKGNDNYLLVNETSLPIIDVNISFNFGSKNDSSKRGITNFAFKLLHKQKYNDKKFISIFEDIGAQFSSSVSKESTNINIRFIKNSDNLEIVATGLGKMLSNRKISTETFDLTKESIIKSIIARDLDPSSILSYKSNEEYFANTSFSHPASGYKNDINNLSIKDIEEHLNKFITQNTIKISFVGDINHAQATRFISAILIDLQNSNDQTTIIPLTNYDKLSRTVNIEHNSEQTHISMMIPALTRTDEDFYNILVANYIFGGGGFGSMLMSEIRVKNGLAYSVFSYLVPYKDIGILKIGMQTETNNTNKAINILNEQLVLFQKFDFDDEKIEEAKLGLIKSFEVRFDTNRKILNTLSAINYLGMYDNYFENYISGINKVTKERIQKAIKSKILFDKKLVLTVGKS